MRDPNFIDEQRNADLLDAMADIAYEQEQAMREEYEPAKQETITIQLTQAMLNQILYCMESMQSDYQEGNADYGDWIDALNALQSKPELEIYDDQA